MSQYPPVRELSLAALEMIATAVGKDSSWMADEHDMGHHDRTTSSGVVHVCAGQVAPPPLVCGRAARAARQARHPTTVGVDEEER